MAEAKSPARATAGPKGLEKEMFDLVNADRANPAYQAETHGQARPLTWDPSLAAVARAHSCDMMKRGFFAHENPDGLLPRQRIGKAGIPWRALAENIAKHQTVAEAETAFMNEPPWKENHRGTILNPQLTHIGIGICSGDGYLWITQDFRHTLRFDSPANAIVVAKCQELISPVPGKRPTVKLIETVLLSKNEALRFNHFRRIL